MENERRVAEHYTHGALERTILDALARMGKDVTQLKSEDLAPVDEFHIGGGQATIAFAQEFGVTAGQHLLDIGSGLGGASRYFAESHDVRVTGIDLTEEFVEVARSLAQLTGLRDRVDYWHGSALDLPFPDQAFDGAYTLHVAMNIPDKAALFAGVRRVLKPDARFGIYDVMRVEQGPLVFPVPWATSESASFVETPASYKQHLDAASFEILKERDRRDFAVVFFKAPLTDGTRWSTADWAPLDHGADRSAENCQHACNDRAGRHRAGRDHRATPIGDDRPTLARNKTGLG